MSNDSTEVKSFDRFTRFVMLVSTIAHCCHSKVLNLTLQILWEFLDFSDFWYKSTFGKTQGINFLSEMFTLSLYLLIEGICSSWLIFTDKLSVYQENLIYLTKILHKVLPFVKMKSFSFNFFALIECRLWSLKKWLAVTDTVIWINSFFNGFSNCGIKQQLTPGTI